MDESSLVVKTMAASWETRKERQAVCLIWQHIQDLLIIEKGALELFIRQLQQALPPLQDMPSADLPALAQHHLGSSADLAATVRLIAPAAFKDDGGPLPNIAALDDVDSSLLGLLTNVIELQLFHLTRAQAITREMRARISRRQQQQQQQAVPGPSTCMCLDGAGSGDNSSGVSSRGDDSMGFLE